MQAGNSQGADTPHAHRHPGNRIHLKGCREQQNPLANMGRKGDNGDAPALLCILVCKFAPLRSVSAKTIDPHPKEAYTFYQAGSRICHPAPTIECVALLGMVELRLGSQDGLQLYPPPARVLQGPPRVKSCAQDSIGQGATLCTICLSSKPAKDHKQCHSHAHN
jgi:hypothetical protein